MKAIAISSNQKVSVFNDVVITSHRERTLHVFATCQATNDVMPTPHFLKSRPVLRSPLRLTSVSQQLSLNSGEPIVS